MKSALLFFLGALCGAVLAAPISFAVHSQIDDWHLGHRGPGSTASARAHTEEKFVFTARGPLERVTPLLGANQERLWAPGWNPDFIYPMPATDAEGMVFTVSRPHARSIWVNTEFDAKNGRVQYAYMIPDVLVTVVTLKLTPEGGETRVEVKYDRTALNPKADAHVRELAEQDRVAGPEWEKQVNGYLDRHKQ